MRMLHWFKQGLNVFSVLLIVCPVYTLIISMSEDQFIWADTLRSTGIYMLMFGLLLPLMFSTILYTQNLPIAISFGSTRAEAFWGIQLSRLSYSLLHLLCSMGLLLASKAFDTDTVLILLVLSGHIFFQGLGGIMSILYNKFQKKGLIAFSLLMTVMILGCTAGFVNAMSSERDIHLPGCTLWLVLGGSILFYCLTSLWEYRTVRNYNIKI